MTTSQPDSEDTVNPSDLASGGFSHVNAKKPTRLTKRKEFLHVAASGIKAVASTLVVQGRHVRPEGQGVRTGFTVTKKTGNSVVRNRIRRRLRAAVAESIGEYGAQGWDFVVIGRATALDAPYEIILRDLRYALRKAAKGGMAPRPAEKKP